MKAVLVKFDGDACVDDKIGLSYKSRRGGRCGAAHAVQEVTESTPSNGGVFLTKRCETLDEIMEQLIQSINKPGNWTGDLQVKKTGHTLMIMCPDSHDDITVHSEFHGKGSLTIEITEL